MDRRVVRVAGVCVIAVACLFLFVSSPLVLSSGPDRASPDSTAPPADGITVITTQDAGRETLENSQIIAFNPNGSVLYYNSTFSTYMDVDPVPGRKTTVIYSASQFVADERCKYGGGCVENHIVKTNLSTGQSEVLYKRMRLHAKDSRWHDVDRIDEDRYIIADLSAIDRAYIVNVSSEIVTWSWDAQSSFQLTSGKGYGNTWTHINDVEVLPDGRVMVSARNQDRVVFINMSTGINESWTLGAENDYKILHEQHNPDYIAKKQGGPAVVVADSENDRVVEYQRDGDSWDRSWSYTDSRLQWPRDADRLPDGHTLITDSNGDRVFEVNREGDIVWSVPIALPYEAERLSTPDESGGAPSATRAGLDSVQGSGTGTDGGKNFRPVLLFKQVLDLLIPDSVVEGIRFISPPWIGLPQYIAISAILITPVTVGAHEIYSRGVSVRIRNPIVIFRK